MLAFDANLAVGVRFHDFVWTIIVVFVVFAALSFEV